MDLCGCGTEKPEYAQTCSWLCDGTKFQDFEQVPSDTEEEVNEDSTYQVPLVPEEEEEMALPKHFDILIFNHHTDGELSKKLKDTIENGVWLKNGQIPRILMLNEAVRLEKVSEYASTKEWLKEVYRRCTWIMPVCTHLLENIHGGYLEDMITNSVSRKDDYRYRIIPAHPPTNYPFYGTVPFGLRGIAGVSCDALFDTTSEGLTNSLLMTSDLKTCGYTKRECELKKLQELLNERLHLRLRREEEELERFDVIRRQ